MVRTLFVFSRRSRKEQARLLHDSNTAADLLYGYMAIDSEKFKTSWICRYQDEWGLLRAWWYPFEYVVARVVKMGFSLHTPLANLSQLRRAGVIICTVDAVGLPIALLKRVGLVQTPLIYISQGLSDRVEGISSKGLRRLVQTVYGWLLRSVERVVVLGEGAIKPVAALFGLREDDVVAIPFGVDEKFWIPGIPLTLPSPHKGEREYVFSVGSDMARDYKTLLAATEGLSVHIVTRLTIVPRAGVKVSTEHSDVELRELYQRAKVVTIPLKDVAQPSGQSATLQAMACGKAVVLTRARGLWEPDVMRHKENCYLVDPYDPAGLRAGIEWLRENPSEALRIGRGARQTVEEHYTARHLAAAIERQIYAAV